MPSASENVPAHQMYCFILSVSFKNTAASPGQKQRQQSSTSYVHTKHNCAQSSTNICGIMFVQQMLNILDELVFKLCCHQHFQGLLEICIHVTKMQWQLSGCMGSRIYSSHSRAIPRIPTSHRICNQVNNQQTDLT